MRISVNGWRELRDFTSNAINFETPSGDLDPYYFIELRDRLKEKYEDLIESAMLTLLEKLPEADREPFWEGFNDLDARVAALDAGKPPDYDKLIRERAKQKPSRADAPLMVLVKKALGVA